MYRTLYTSDRNSSKTDLFQGVSRFKIRSLFQKLKHLEKCPIFQLFPSDCITLYVVHMNNHAGSWSEIQHPRTRHQNIGITTTYTKKMSQNLKNQISDYRKSHRFYNTLREAAKKSSFLVVLGLGKKSSN